jgi:hypothetical protein
MASSLLNPDKLKDAFLKSLGALRAGVVIASKEYGSALLLFTNTIDVCSVFRDIPPDNRYMRC